LRKKNVKLWNHLLKELNDFEIKGGWFEESKYDDGTPVAGIAAVQNFGAHINQTVTEKQRAFLHYIGIHLKKETDKLNIIIPARPFMDNAKERIRGQEGTEVLLKAMLQVFEGKLTMKQATEQLALYIQQVIQEELKKIQEPPLAEMTIKQRASKYVSKAKKPNKTTSNKPLNSTGIMFATVQGKAEIKKK